jgi:hypothetical protein
VLHAQIYLITNSFGGRQAVGGSYADFVLEFGYVSNEKIRQSAALLALYTVAQKSFRPIS